MTCLTLMKIRQYIDGELSDRNSILIIDEHLKICPGCREILQREKKRTHRFKESLKKLYPDKIPSLDPRTFKEKRPQPSKIIAKYTWWAAAAIILVTVSISLSFLFNQSTKRIDDVDAMISSVKLNGNPARSYVFKKNKPEMTIFWIEENNQGDNK